MQSACQFHIVQVHASFTLSESLCHFQALHRMLDARQLGLKLIANVTYGYTGATFSGRMPCIEVRGSLLHVCELAGMWVLKMGMGVCLG